MAARGFNFLPSQANAAPNVDIPMVDNAETIYISSLSLLKMLKHGKFDKEFWRDLEFILC